MGLSSDVFSLRTWERALASVRFWDFVLESSGSEAHEISSLLRCDEKASEDGEVEADDIISLKNEL